jgi:hypothetical protein
MSIEYSRAASPSSQRQVVRSCDGRIIGHLEEHVFHKSVSGSKHKLRRPPAWAIDAGAFDEVIRPIAKVFRIEDKETGTVYEVSVAYFDQHKGEFDRGFGRQYFLPLARWNTERNGNGGRQLTLWEGGDDGYS